MKEKTDKKMKHPLACIHPDANIASTVEIEPFAIIDKNVVIGEGTRIGSNVRIMEGTRIGKNCRIFPGAVIGAIPQDLKFRGEETLAVIGDNTTIREFVTVNRGTVARGKTIIGNNCLIMAYCHIAHDCMLGNHIIMANTPQLAEEVVIDAHAILSGGILVHQFTRISSHVMIQGGSKINKDVPLFVKAGRTPVSDAGINAIGLRRRNYTKEQIENILNIYRYLYSMGMNTSQALERIETEFPVTKERDDILLFVRGSSRGIIKGRPVIGNFEPSKNGKVKP